MPTDKEIAAGAKAIRDRYEDMRVRLHKSPTIEELAQLALEAAEKVRTLPKAKLEDVNSAE